MGEHGKRFGVFLIHSEIMEQGKTPMQLHEERLEQLRRRVAKADKTTIVAFPYRLQPSLAVTEYEMAMFDLYSEMFLNKPKRR